MKRIQGDPKDVLLPSKWEALLNNLGHTCRKMKKYEEALGYHQQALVLDTLNPSTYSAIGFIHAQIGNTQEAVDAFHKALGLRRDDTFTTTMLGYVMEQIIEETPPYPGTYTIKHYGKGIGVEEIKSWLQRKSQTFIYLSFCSLFYYT